MKNIFTKQNCCKSIIVLFILFSQSAFAQDVEEVLPKEVTFSSFPNKHPLIVHFPIVLLIVSFGFQLLILFKLENVMLKWLTFLLMLGGSIGAFLAIYVIQAHISGDVPDEIFDTFKTHQRFAMFTLWASITAVVLRLITNLWLKKIWMEYIVMLAITASALLVSITGHYGAGLTYIYGVGPKGNYILTK